ncbi:ferritin-like domain-containing protein [Candidatus Tisiphia endosymbiont of Hybos culiciformis]|uniref:ferritin-like domain-containing protein n=1 Tax=Candidatus Tisiphia endosymbiont of Hybos culiciformis TaxID=3139331 RepID=UPI003CCAFE2A
MKIRNKKHLQELLQTAIELEHTIIPPYLCAAYSLMPDSNPDAYNLIISVVKEEMLHITLAANVLNAIGGNPRIGSPQFVPNYPAYLPHSNDSFLISLACFSEDSIDLFLRIEKPEDTGASPKETLYSTIKQFYDAIIDGLKYLVHELGEKEVFSGNINRQFGTNLCHYGAGGKDIKVHDLATALSALNIIIEQGEGMDRTIYDAAKGSNKNQDPNQELAHYFRFNEIKQGRRYKNGDTVRSGPTGDKIKINWDKVYNIYPNSKLSDYPKDSELYENIKLFNQKYTGMLKKLEQAFNGTPDIVHECVATMLELKYLALQIMKSPFPKDKLFNASPSFEYMPGC